MSNFVEEDLDGQEKLSYARQYRPTTFEGYIGNEKIKETVTNLLSKGNYPQSILVTGNTGCGKTTIGRIIESWYMCESPQEDGSPCGECITCTYMKEYIRTGKCDMLSDIQEIDVTENSGKADMNRILEEIEYPSYSGGWKVYILDECHEMSSGAANRLLKVVEEPPEKVLIIFCTTDPQKMLETLKNRCQLKLKVMKPTLKDLGKLLIGICNKEGVEYDSEGIRMICSRGDFVIRDSLNYLEQVIKSRGDALASSVASEFLEVSDKIIFDFYEAYIEKDEFSYINVIYRIKTTYDFAMFMQSLINFTIRGTYVVNSIPVDGLSEAEISSYMDVFSKFSLKTLTKVLAELLQISSKSTNIEASLIAFMYSNVEVDKLGVSITDTQNEKVDFKRGKSTKVCENTTTGKSENSLSSMDKERQLRNRNIENLNNRIQEESINSLDDYGKEKPFEEMMGLFNLERVKKG